MAVVGYERDDGVALITLKRSEVRNAQNPTLLAEYHGHTWEWGPRKAKEMLFTGRRMTAEEAHEVGMVTRVIKREHLHDEALSLAREISQMDPFGLAQIKRAVNHTVDVQGQHVALQAAFDIHWLGHTHALSRTANRQAIMADLATMKAAGGASQTTARSTKRS
jgi:enoyl-CoA hydratase